MQLELTHNPYRIETELLINDKLCSDSWFIDLIEDIGVQKRLQMWIMDFFPMLHKAYPKEQHIRLIYSGTTADGDDIVEEANIAQKKLGLEIVVKTIPCGEPDRKFDQLLELYKKAKNGPYEGFKTIELGKAFADIESRELSVSVMAPMKNGKSTLLNAIIGEELLPNEAQRCTAKISYIHHEPDASTFQAKAVISDDDAQDFLPCDINLLREWNAQDDVRRVIIRGVLPGIQIRDYKLQFVDTPGPDSATHKEDSVTVERFLSDNSLPMVCYIIDRVNTTEENYLKRLKDHVSSHGKQSEDRFIFVVTRMDHPDISKEATATNNPIKQKLDKIVADLKKIGIANPRVFPVSALIALKARKYSRITDEEELDDFADDFKSFNKKMKRIGGSLNQYMPLSTSVRKKLTSEIETIQARMDSDEDTPEDRCRYMELLSGVPALEMTIEEYLLKYSVPARISDAALFFENGIAKAQAERELLTQIEKNKITLAEINKNIAKLYSILKDGKAAKTLRAQFVSRKWKESKEFKKTLEICDRDYRSRIKEKLQDLTPIDKQDANGNIDPSLAEKIVQKFGAFMDNLSGQLIGEYANAVDSDAEDLCKEMVEIYNSYLENIIGDIPPELQAFYAKIKGTFANKLPRLPTKVSAVIHESTETYIEKVTREITMRADGFWKNLVASLPFTETTTEEDVERQRVIKKVSFKKLKDKLFDDSGDILQKGIEDAEAKSEEQFSTVKGLMLEEFDRMDGKLKDLEKELSERLNIHKQTSTEQKKTRDRLDWVQAFKNQLDHILDMDSGKGI